MTTTIQPTLVQLPSNDSRFIAWQAQWVGLTNGAVGAPIDLVDFTDRSIQVEGTFGSGGTVVIQGTNDPYNTVSVPWETLRDPSSTSLSLTSAGLHGILEMTAQIRPDVTGGDGTTLLTVTMFLRRTIR
jgi:hypothetical protein